MEEAFFIASKTLGLLARAESWLVILLAVSLIALMRGRWAMGRAFLALGLALLLVLTFFPLGNVLLYPLERQYPANPPLSHVDGIIVLGGAEDPASFVRWKVAGFNDAGERFVAGAELARRYPAAKLVFTGGTASLFSNPGHSWPSKLARQLFLDLGVPEGQIVLEDASRTTAENAAFTRDLVKPQPGQTWVLVTSAFHMPRAMATLERAGWQGLVAWPVDFRSGGPTWRLEWKLGDHLMDLDIALKEYLGAFAYWLAGK